MPLIVKVAETKEEIRGLRELRALVFVWEQGVPKDLEIDEFDVDAIHIVGCSDTVSYTHMPMPPICSV